MQEYYWSAGQRIPLVRDAEAVAVRFHDGAKGRRPMEPEAAELMKERMDPVMVVEHRGIKVFRTDRQSRAVEVLGRQDAIAFATPLYRRSPGSEELMIVTADFLVKFHDDVDRARIDAIGERHGVRIVETLGYARNAFRLQSVVPGRSAVDLANLYREREPTDWAHPVLIRRQARKETAAAAAVRRRRPADRSAEMVGRIVPADRRWHLGPGQTRVTEAWTLPELPADCRQGARSIRVAVLDDGIDVAHPDFAGRVVAQFDFEANVADARPKTASDRHGTACAGVAVGGAGGPASGAAPGCSLIAVRTPSMLGVDEEARMFQWAADQGADVISCSWGPTDGTGNLDPLPDNVGAAIRHCVTAGRGGKGIPIFWAAGNGDEPVSLDGYAANPDVIAVAASTSRNVRAWYSDHGPEIWICAPSNGDDAEGELSIFATDRTGAAGYNPGDPAKGDAAGNYTGTFGGTSSATPLAAGIAALVLSAHPDLTESPTRGRTVREILAATATKIGDGYVDGHSPRFGFGRIDAAAAVREALRRKGGATAAAPVLSGPASWPRGGPPPTFRVDPGPGRYFAVEVATDPAMVGPGSDATGAGPDTYYASWNEPQSLLAAPVRPTDWTMPADAWARLSAADAIHAAVWSSSDPDGWSDEAGSAPVTVVVAVPGENPGGGTGGRPSIRAAASVDRHGPSPVFAVDPGPGRFFAVEVATAAHLLDQTNHDADRTEDTFFATWSLPGPLLSDAPYPAPWPLPDDVWARMRGADALHYRIHASAAADGWVGATVSVDDADAASAPSIALSGGRSAGAVRTVAARTRTSGDGGGPGVTGPDVHPADAPDPPGFLVTFDGVPALVLEVVAEGGEGEAAPVRSEILRPEPGFDTRLWRMDADAWARMRTADRLDCRLIDPAKGGGDPVDRIATALTDRSARRIGRLARQLPAREDAARMDEAAWRARRPV